MEGNFQNLRDNQTDAKEAVNNDEIPQDTKLVQLEISKMKETRRRILESSANLEQKLNEEQKAVQEKQAATLQFEKEIVELQGKLNDEKYQNDTLQTDIGNMREMAKEIGKFCVRNESTLQRCSQDKLSATEKNEKLKTKLCDNIAKLEAASKKIQSEIKLTSENSLSQQEIYQDCFEKSEEESLEIKTKLEISNAELENLKQQSDELLQETNNCLKNIGDTEENNKKLEEVWHHTQKHSASLLEQMEEELRVFEQRKEEISNSLDEARYTLQKKETEIEVVQRGIKNQTEYNKNFREKLAKKIKEITELRQETEQLEAVQNEKHIQLVSDEESLTVLFKSKLEEEQNAKALLSEEHKILNKTEEQIKDAKQINEELIRHIETQENIVADLKEKQNNQLEAVTAFEQNLSSLQLKLSNLKEELSEWQKKFVTYESNMLEAIANRTASVKSIGIETEKIKIEEQETAKTIVQEMDSIKINFDINTAQEMSDFEEKQKQLQAQIQMIEKELSYTRTLQVQLDEEFQQLNKGCDNISQKIKDQENVNRTLFNIPDFPFEPPVETLLPPVDRRARPGTSRGSGAPRSTLTKPPSGPTKPRAFDELSGSSVEGNVSTVEQILEFRQRKRRQLQRVQAKKSSNSHNSNKKAGE